MKELGIFPVVLVLWFANQLVDSKLTCKENEYIVVKNGTESECLPCNHCPEGFGLSPPCGSRVKHPPPIDCVPCVPGKTYSDGHDPSTCKNCHLCSAKEIVTKKCTTYENTVCSNTCEKGFYYENSTHGCQPCSYCCAKDKDIRIKECQNMPSNKQCSVHSDQGCKPKTTAAVVTAYPSSTTKGTSSTRAVTKQSSTNKVIAPVIGSLVAMGIVIGLFYCIKKSKMFTKKVSGRTEVMMEDGAGTQLLNDNCRELDRHMQSNMTNEDLCDLIHMEFNTTNKSMNLRISEGQSISLTCKNQNDDNRGDNRKCNFGFEWKKDGDSIPGLQTDTQDLTVDNVEVAHSGRYYCEIHCTCNSHRNHKKYSSALEIHILPGEGKELKKFNKLRWHVEEKIKNWLQMPKTVGIGNWMDLGREFEMDDVELKALDKDQAEQVLAYIKSRYPNLTVFKFCEVLKRDTMKQNKIVVYLKDELTISTPKIAKSDNKAFNRPDSGISEESDFDGQLQVDLTPLKVPAKTEDSSKPPPRHALNRPILNFSYTDSSRDASRESSMEDICSFSKMPSVENAKPVEDSDGQLQVDLPPLKVPTKTEDSSKLSKLPRHALNPTLLNPGYADSSRDASRESSIEDIPGSFSASVQNTKPDISKKSRSRFSRQSSKESHKSDDTEDFVPKERRRSRSSSFSSAIKEIMSKQPSVEYSQLGQHHEESDEAERSGQDESKA